MPRRRNRSRSSSILSLDSRGKTRSRTPQPRQKRHEQGETQESQEARLNVLLERLESRRLFQPGAADDVSQHVSHAAQPVADWTGWTAETVAAADTLATACAAAATSCKPAARRTAVAASEAAPAARAVVAGRVPKGSAAVSMARARHISQDEPRPGDDAAKRVDKPQQQQSRGDAAGPEENVSADQS